ncbi:hypothetical protein CCH79_00001999 [Gambusia affinis]|uniref:Uncharacterized protein n=1 Tax=Gambusia affinis TaxID=33528 RepID=A0A315VIV0_GAMAF|nr:hypothetical protein CCH79_00001999 [Gambusia affinis]
MVSAQLSARRHMSVRKAPLDGAAQTAAEPVDHLNGTEDYLQAAGHQQSAEQSDVELDDVLRRGLIQTSNTLHKGPLCKPSTATTKLYRAPSTPTAAKAIDRNICKGDCCSLTLGRSGSCSPVRSGVSFENGSTVGGSTDAPDEAVDHLADTEETLQNAGHHQGDEQTHVELDHRPVIEAEQRHNEAVDSTSCTHSGKYDGKEHLPKLNEKQRLGAPVRKEEQNVAEDGQENQGFPQLLKLLWRGSAEGLSLTAFLLQLYALSCPVVYAAANNFPFL